MSDLGSGKGDRRVRQVALEDPFGAFHSPGFTRCNGSFSVGNERRGPADWRERKELRWALDYGYHYFHEKAENGGSLDMQAEALFSAAIFNERLPSLARSAAEPGDARPKIPEEIEDALRDYANAVARCADIEDDGPIYQEAHACLRGRRYTLHQVIAAAIRARR
jgi:hypothetical protein